MRLPTPAYPPTDGSLYIHEVADFHLERNPDLPAYIYSEDPSKDGITSISYLEFGRACHRVAHYVRPLHDKPLQGRPVVGLLALSDVLLYHALNIGMMRANVVPFPISHRNSVPAVINLLMKTSCHRLLVTEHTLKSLVDAIRDEMAVKDPTYVLIIEEVPSLAEIFPKMGFEKSSDPFSPYPRPSERPSQEDTAMYLHSSGSTGFPKPVAEPHRVLSSWGALPFSTSFRAYDRPILVAAMHMPPFHSLAFNIQVIFPMFTCWPAGLYPPTAIRPDALPIMPTPENIIDHIKRTRCNLLWTAPSLLKIWSQDKESMEVLKQLEYVLYGGGALAPKLLDQIASAGVNLLSGYGTTEYSSPLIVFKRPEDRADTEYMEFWEGAHVRWAPQGDGTYECQLLATGRVQLAVENLPDTRGYASSDIFEPHPTKKHLWRIVGRIDDVIVHSSGEKTVPMMFEDLVMTSPYVIGAIMFGQAHSQPGILIEPDPKFQLANDSQEALAQFRNRIWPVIEEANAIVPAFSRVFKEMILPVMQGKPLPRAGKGTVLRKFALQTYQVEIEELYATVESTQVPAGLSSPMAWYGSSLRRWLLEQAVDLVPGKDIRPDVDLFEQGFDSLSVTILRRRIAGALQSSIDESAQRAVHDITQNTLYSYPTINQLAAFITTKTSGKRLHESKATNTTSHVTEIERMISKYSAPPSKGTVVLLTGSTGNLGSYILEAVLKDSRVTEIYALNRGSDSKSLFQRQGERFRDKGLDEKLLSSPKLKLLTVDLSAPNLSLPLDTYHKIRTSVTTIIHNAWRLDFNLALSSFESNIRGSKNLMDLAVSSPNKATIKFLFTSSIGTTMSWDKTLGPYPEEVIRNPKYAVGTGYGESKYVTEILLTKSGINATSIRLGQICGGAPDGAWTTTDWVPIIVKSSLAMGILPNAAGVASWIPADAVTNTILDLIFTPDPLPPALNLVHPSPTSWNTVFKEIQHALFDQLDMKTPLPLVPLYEWVHKLESQCPRMDETTLPALKLITFLRGLADSDKQLNRSTKPDDEAVGLAKLSMTKIKNLSPSLKARSPLNCDDVARWVRYWKGRGFLN